MKFDTKYMYTLNKIHDIKIILPDTYDVYHLLYEGVIFNLPQTRFCARFYIQYTIKNNL